MEDAPGLHSATPTAVIFPTGFKEDELVGAPGFVKARRQALGAGEGAP